MRTPEFTVAFISSLQMVMGQFKGLSVIVFLDFIEVHFDELLDSIE